jgi:hypothetical protein
MKRATGKALTGNFAVPGIGRALSLFGEPLF